jgi:hypothetical protein
MAARNPFASSELFDDPYGLAASRRPVRHSTGYYFVRNLLLVGAVAGGIVAAYRNDVFRDLARQAGLEQRYLDAEKFLVGTPGWGTPRSMEPVLNAADTSAEAHGVASTDTSTPATTTAALTATAAADTAAPGAAATPPAPAPVTAPEPSSPAPTTLAVAGRGKGAAATPVGVASLPVLTRGTPRPAEAEASPRRAALAAAPVTHAAPAPVTHASAARSAPVDHAHAKAIKVSLDEDAPAERPTRHAATHAAAPPDPPAAVATKPQKPEKAELKAAEVHAGDNPLLAAVRGAVRSRPPKGE